VELVVDTHDRAEVTQRRVGGCHDRKGEVSPAVAGQLVARAHGAGEDDPAAGRRGPGEQVGEECALLDGVGAMDDHDTIESILKDGRAGSPGKAEHGGRRHVPAGFCQHVLDDHSRGEQVGGDAREELRSGRDGLVSGASRVGKSLLGGEQKDSRHSGSSFGD